MGNPNQMLGKMAELFVHHYNLTGALSREAAAKGYGLDPEPYKHPYPGSTNYSVTLVQPGEAKAEARAESIPSPPPPQKGLGWLPLVLGGLATPGLIAGIAALAMWLNNKPAQSAPANPTPIIKIPDPQGLEAQIEVEWGPGKGENGQFGARYRLGPDGQWITIPNKPPQ